MDLELLTIPAKITENMHVIWTFMLLIVRFTALISIIPGIGMGLSGVYIRTPAVLVLALTCLEASPKAPLPEDWVQLLVGLSSEFMFGAVLGLVPMMIVNGVQTAGQLASTSMGLQASQLIDPTLQLSVPDLARICGDIVIIIFLLLNGHHVAIYTAAGLGGEIVPGTFLASGNTLEMLINNSARIFELGAVLAAPVIVALMLTNFVMGLITKAVPTVNIFIVSFPLTIGIGLLVSMLALPEMVVVAKRHITGMESSILEVTRDAGVVR